MFMEILVLQIMDPDSDFRISLNLNYSGKLIMMPDFLNMTPLSSFFNVVLFLLSSFVSKFHFNIITGSGVITFFVYNGLTGNREIGNTRVWILPYKSALR